MMRYLIPVGLILAFCWANTASAQFSRGSLTGSVVDNSTEAPVDGALVQLLDGMKRSVDRTMADSGGSFHFGRVRPGTFYLSVSRIGYRATVSPGWRVEAGEHLEVEIRLEEDAVLLAPLTIVASRRSVEPSPMLANFRARIENGFGAYITRADMERNPRPLITDHLATVPGVQLVSSGSGLRRSVYMNRARPGRDCPAQIYIDGFLLNRRMLDGADMGFRLDDAVSPMSVEGIEIYRGLSGVPAEFMSPEAACGVIAIWTRRGDVSGR